MPPASASRNGAAANSVSAAAAVKAKGLAGQRGVVADAARLLRHRLPELATGHRRPATHSSGESTGVSGPLGAGGPRPAVANAANTTALTVPRDSVGSVRAAEIA